MAKDSNPISGLFPQIKKILNYIVVKNSREADKYETPEMARESDIYHLALLEQDTYLLYTDMFTVEMFLQISPMIRRELIRSWIENPYNVPLIYHDYLCEMCRKIVIENHVEKNEYYRKLNGLPPLEATEDDFVYVPERIRNTIYSTHTIPDVPIHEMNSTDQDLISGDPWFQSYVEAHPEKEYLKYIGRLTIDPVVARKARDLELIRFIPNGDFVDLNPYLLKDFTSIYNNYRDYMIFNLYNKNFEVMYENYRPFMMLLLTLFVINQLDRKSVV